jgi:beta-glucosidase
MTTAGKALTLMAISIVPQLLVAQAAQPWLDSQRSPDERARLAVAAMTLDEQIGMLHGPMALTLPIPGLAAVALPAEAIPAGGYIPGVARLGIPALFETDASLGVTNPMGVRPGDVATALPAGLALASSFNPALAYRAGAMVGSEAHAKGFDVLLGGGMNLTRDPRNGRNFEYLGEDPLLAGVLAGEEVRGTQDQHVISTLKHFALNANETNRFTLDAQIDKAALRESDLLAFQLAIERGRPGSVMCAYNKINGEYACGNDWLLNQVLKGDWGYQGWVMSDWGAVHATDDALAGLDQQSGEQLDRSIWFGTPLKSAVEHGSIPASRVRDMARRILRSMFAVGVVENPPVKSNIDYKSHAALALDIARQGIVLLKNDTGLLPIGSNVRSIAVIGGMAHAGVLSGGGSSQVIPANGPPVLIPVGGNGPLAMFRTMLFDPSPPLAAIRSAWPQARVSYDAGAFPADAAMLASQSDVAIVFVTRHDSEHFDIPNLELPYGQDALVEAVSAANPHTIVVLEAGNPVTMPWLDTVPTVLMAWYPGQEGGQAIADILSGAVNPSGRLPITFPRGDADTVRPRLPNLGSEERAEVSIDYSEGGNVGYRWYQLNGVPARFAFGHGLSYTRFTFDGIHVTGGRTLKVSMNIHNVGSRSGAVVPQVYLTSAAGKKTFRLLGFERVELNPGEHRAVTITADPRLLGSFDESKRQWTVTAGAYQVGIGNAANEIVDRGEAYVSLSTFGSGALP